jgi:hypothetical protein
MIVVPVGSAYLVLRLILTDVAYIVSRSDDRQKTECRGEGGSRSSFEKRTGHRKAVGKVGCWERATLLPAQHREAASPCWAERPAAKAFGTTFPTAFRCPAT